MKSALVTGATKRIGKMIALSLAERGFDIALHYNLSDPGEIISEIEARGVEAHAFRCDLGEAGGAACLVEEVVAEMDGLELLINNASIFERGPIRESSNDLLKRHFEVNLFAPFILTRDFANICKSGHIINITDTQVAKNRTTYAAYLLSKKSLADLTRISALELGPDIRVNAVAPGLIMAPAEIEDGDKYLERLAQRSPLLKRGAVTDITQAVGFLIDNDYMTGQTIYMDGGDHIL